MAHHRCMPDQVMLSSSVDVRNGRSVDDLKGPYEVLLADVHFTY